MKNTLVQLQAEVKVTLHGRFFKFFKLGKWYQITQSVTIMDNFERFIIHIWHSRSKLWGKITHFFVHLVSIRKWSHSWYETTIKTATEIRQLSINHQALRYLNSASESNNFIMYFRLVVCCCKDITFKTLCS